MNNIDNNERADKKESPVGGFRQFEDLFSYGWGRKNVEERCAPFRLAHTAAYTTSQRRLVGAMMTLPSVVRYICLE